MSAIVAGQPDFGVLTQTEMFDHIRRICRATTVPVFADADTGYGGSDDDVLSGFHRLDQLRQRCLGLVSRHS